MVATARLASFNIKEIANMTDTDTMELNRIGMPLDDNSPLLKQINSESNKTIGNGKVASNVGGIRIETLDSWIASFGWKGWGWNGGTDYSK